MYNILNITFYKWYFSLITIHSQNLLDCGDQLGNNLSLATVNLLGIIGSHIFVTFQQSHGKVQILLHYRARFPSQLTLRWRPQPYDTAILSTKLLKLQKDSNHLLIISSVHIFMGYIVTRSDHHVQIYMFHLFMYAGCHLPMSIPSWRSKTSPWLEVLEPIISVKGWPIHSWSLLIMPTPLYAFRLRSKYEVSFG